MTDDRTVAYFSMEIALEEGMPTYSGGLGVLAGDMIRSAANFKVPMVAVTLLHRKGYFYQKLDSNGQQIEEPVEWMVDDFLTELPQRVSLPISHHDVSIRTWRYEVKGSGGYIVPVYFLDTDLPENSDEDRTLTHFLYGGDAFYRLRQEAILGIGGIRMLRALGHRKIEHYHMNEGHASLLVLELIKEHVENSSAKSLRPDDIEDIREQCVFTTHTPIPAGHDKFSKDMVHQVLHQHITHINEEMLFSDGCLNMTQLALNFSGYINGVAKKHKEVSNHMFAPYILDSITNGVNAAVWTCPPFQKIFDKYISGWREDNFSLRYALNIPANEVWDAHTKAKRQLLQYVNHETNAGMDMDVLTLGFARRAAAYKRADLIFEDIDRLKQMTSQHGPLQMIFAGKAHPHDTGGKEVIQKIHQIKSSLKENVKIAYLLNYNMALAKLIIPGVDVWLNTPMPPHEASGTSGMKAALNGVPSLSVLDGWWIEGCIEGITGWSIGQPPQLESAQPDASKDAISLYEKLEQVVIPMYYHDREHFISIMIHAIALNGSFFNTQRMIQQYALKAYL
jgi:starch phosphorylase